MTNRKGFAGLTIAATLGLLFLGGVTAATRAAEDGKGPRGAQSMPPPLMDGDHGPGPGRCSPARIPFPPPPRISDALARAEVEIGIRAPQLDAWRDFTDAALAVLEPPHPPKPQSGEKAGEAQPFAKVLALADDAAARGRKAEQLKSAVDVLKAKLTPDQLQKVADLEARLAPPPPPPMSRPGDFVPGPAAPSPHP